MSFDLWFARKRGLPSLDLEEIKAWFKKRPHYDPSWLENNQVMYENQDTGVYFIFEFGDFFDPDEIPDTDRPIEIVLLLNYLRPKFFALECRYEVKELVDALQLEIIDPQETEENFSAFNAENFLQSYAKHNKQAVNSIRKNHNYEPKPVPTEKLIAAWKWNYRKSTLENETSVDVFFPTIFWFETEREISSAIVWGDGIPTVIPPCDSIYLHWDELSQRKVLGVSLGQPKIDQLYDVSVFEDIFAQFYELDGSDGCLWPREYRRPEELAKRLRAFDVKGDTATMLRSDSVIDDIFC